MMNAALRIGLSCRVMRGYIPAKGESTTRLERNNKVEIVYLLYYVFKGI